MWLPLNIIFLSLSKTNENSRDVFKWERCFVYVFNVLILTNIQIYPFCFVMQQKYLTLRAVLRTTDICFYYSHWNVCTKRNEVRPFNIKNTFCEHSNRKIESISTSLMRLPNWSILQENKKINFSPKLASFTANNLVFKFLI